MKNTIKGGDFFSLALLAFGGLGLELVLVSLIEPILYQASLKEWSAMQNILHWLCTCTLWGIVCTLLLLYAKKKYQFNAFEKTNQIRAWQWSVIALILVAMLIVHYFDWNGFKVVKEFRSNGYLKFIFQYIYYLFETALFTLIIVFGQKAGELWFDKEHIPYGGFAIALSWGLIHILTKGSVGAGMVAVVSGLAFGSVYLLVNKDIKLTVLICFFMFVL